MDDSDAFFSCLQTFAPKSFRVNTIKAWPEKVRARLESYGFGIKPVKWCDHAFTSDSLAIGSTLEHFLGHIYMQELASMLPPLIAREEIAAANTVLDGCAAPGSKTTEIAALMENQGLIVANDLDYGRIRALKFNIEKTGALNTVITNQDLRYFPLIPFDLVFIDAPCSAEGTIRKNPEVLDVWNEAKVFGSSGLQKQLILRGFDFLPPGGTMIYSTCTFAPEENEAVVDWLLEKRQGVKLEEFALEGFKFSPTVEEWQVKRFNDEVKKARRVWPHHNNTDGFFIAKVRKE